MIEVHLYGKLRQYGPTPDVREPCVISASPSPGHSTVGDFVAALGIPGAEVASVFCDGRWEREGLRRPLEGITRLGFFPRTMTLLYI